MEAGAPTPVAARTPAATTNPLAKTMLATLANLASSGLPKKPATSFTVLSTAFFTLEVNLSTASPAFFQKLQGLSLSGSGMAGLGGSFGAASRFKVFPSTSVFANALMRSSVLTSKRVPPEGRGSSLAGVCSHCMCCSKASTSLWSASCWQGAVGPVGVFNEGGVSIFVMGVSGVGLERV